MSPYTDLVGSDARKAADAVKVQLEAGTFVIFKGPLNDNMGKEVIAKGKEYIQTAIELEGMDYLVQGVIGR